MDEARSKKERLEAVEGRCEALRSQRERLSRSSRASSDTMRDILSGIEERLNAAEAEKAELLEERTDQNMSDRGTTTRESVEEMYSDMMRARGDCDKVDEVQDEHKEAKDIGEDQEASMDPSRDFTADKNLLRNNQILRRSSSPPSLSLSLLKNKRLSSSQQSQDDRMKLAFLTGGRSLGLRGNSSTFSQGSESIRASSSMGDDLTDGQGNQLADVRRHSQWQERPTGVQEESKQGQKKSKMGLGNGTRYQTSDFLTESGPVVKNSQVEAAARAGTAAAVAAEAKAEIAFRKRQLEEEEHARQRQREFDEAQRNVERDKRLEAEKLLRVEAAALKAALENEKKRSRAAEVAAAEASEALKAALAQEKDKRIATEKKAEEERRRADAAVAAAAAAARESAEKERDMWNSLPNKPSGSHDPSYHHVSSNAFNIFCRHSDSDQEGTYSKKEEREHDSDHHSKKKEEDRYNGHETHCTYPYHEMKLGEFDILKVHVPKEAKAGDVIEFPVKTHGMHAQAKVPPNGSHLWHHGRVIAIHVPKSDANAPQQLKKPEPDTSVEKRNHGPTGDQLEKEIDPERQELEEWYTSASLLEDRAEELRKRELVLLAQEPEPQHDSNLPDPSIDEVSGEIDRVRREAAMLYERCVERDSDYCGGNAAYNLGGIYQDLGQDDQAAVLYEKAIRSASAVMEQRRGESHKTNSADADSAMDYGCLPSAHYNLGILHDSAGRFSEAIKAYETALIFVSEWPEARHNLMLARKELFASHTKGKKEKGPSPRGVDTRVEETTKLRRQVSFAPSTDSSWAAESTSSSSEEEEVASLSSLGPGPLPTTRAKDTTELFGQPFNNEDVEDSIRTGSSDSEENLSEGDEAEATRNHRKQRYSGDYCSHQASLQHQSRKEGHVEETVSDSGDSSDSEDFTATWARDDSDDKARVGNYVAPQRRIFFDAPGMIPTTAARGDRRDSTWPRSGASMDEHRDSSSLEVAKEEAQRSREWMLASNRSRNGEDERREEPFIDRIPVVAQAVPLDPVYEGTEHEEGEGGSDHRSSFYQSRQRGTGSRTSLPARDEERTGAAERRISTSSSSGRFPTTSALPGRRPTIGGNLKKKNRLANPRKEQTMKMLPALLKQREDVEAGLQFIGSGASLGRIDTDNYYDNHGGYDDQLPEERNWSALRGGAEHLGHTKRTSVSALSDRSNEGTRQHRMSKRMSYREFGQIPRKSYEFEGSDFKHAALDTPGYVRYGPVRQSVPRQSCGVS